MAKRIGYMVCHRALAKHRCMLDTTTEGCSNNEAESEAIIVGLELSLEVSIDDLTIYRDSKLIIRQLKGEYQIRKPNLFPYYERADYLLSKFPKLQIRHVHRGENGRADALASLAASLGLSENKEMTITVGERRILQPYEKVVVDVQVEEVFTMSKRLKGQDNPLDWRLPFMEYLQGGRLGDDRAK
ncbi:hypothetical protein RJ639_028523 [Escallonia herrerae]|uniref:RNase H type-1 domain-containing protein n=1 Tax=Escallonia herrerae TaxID=1293975 RepID=A0AA88X369_9ASTE|nr:hypothetical protein RJ639_028523 [Escallonia herrerae]